MSDNVPKLSKNWPIGTVVELCNRPEFYTKEELNVEGLKFKIVGPCCRNRTITECYQITPLSGPLKDERFDFFWRFITPVKGTSVREFITVPRVFKPKERRII